MKKLIALVLVIAASVTVAQVMQAEAPCPQVPWRGTDPVPLHEMLTSRGIDPGNREAWLTLMPDFVTYADATFTVNAPRESDELSDTAPPAFDRRAFTFGLTATAIGNDGMIRGTVNGLWRVTIRLEPLGDRWVRYRYGPDTEAANDAGINWTTGVVEFVQEGRGTWTLQEFDTCGATECKCNDDRSGGCAGEDDCANGKTCKGRSGTSCEEEGVAGIGCGELGLCLPLLAAGMGMMKR